MTHFRIDPPRINREDRKHRSSYCHECLERFTADDVRCSYGTRYFHKEQRPLSYDAKFREQHNLDGAGHCEALVGLPLIDNHLSQLDADQRLAQP
jgi:hypothetical protein